MRRVFTANWVLGDPKLEDLERWCEKLPDEFLATAASWLLAAREVPRRESGRVSWPTCLSELVVRYLDEARDSRPARVGGS
jgi:hypothetical protein